MGLAWSRVASKLVGPDLAIDVRLKLLASALVDEDEPLRAFNELLLMLLLLAAAAADDMDILSSPLDDNVDADSGQWLNSARNSMGSKLSITRVTFIEY